MIWIIITIIVVVCGIIYFNYITVRDFGSVDKYGGLKNKYAVFISKILERNPFYSLHEKNLNYVEITNTGMLFILREINKKLRVTWHWKSFTTGKTYEIKWSFGENEDPEKMYRQVIRI